MVASLNERFDVPGGAGTTVLDNAEDFRIDAIDIYLELPTTALSPGEGRQPAERHK